MAKKYTIFDRMQEQGSFVAVPKEERWPGAPLVGIEVDDKGRRYEVTNYHDGREERVLIRESRNSR